MPITSIQILAVDDEPDLCALTKEFLERSGEMKVDTANLVQEARDALAVKRYDAIVSDYQMPGEDGIQFLKTLREKGDRTPFILFTGKGREEVAIEALNHGADAYLQKGGEPRSLFAELEHRIDATVRRHRAEAALLDSESEFRLLFDENPDIVVLIGFDGTTLNCNQAAADMVMMPKEEIVGRTLSSMGAFSPEDLALFQTSMIAKYKGEHVPHILTQVHRRDGTVRWVELRSSVVMRTGRFHGFQILGRDITEQKRAEDLVKESEQRLSDIINFLPDATFAIDGVGNVIAWNRAIEELTGFPAIDIVGKGDHEYSIPFYGERRPILIDLVTLPEEELTKGKYSNIKREGGAIIAETCLPSLMGKYSILMCKASVLYDHEGKVVGAIESIRDITESRRVENALLAEQEKYVKTFLAVPDGIAISDIDSSKILVVNDAAFRLFGYTREEMIGKSAIELGIWFDVEDRAELLARLKEEGRVQDYIEKWRRKSGEVFSAELSADIITLDGKKVLLLVIRDITERMKGEQSLRRTNEELQEVNEQLAAAEEELRQRLDIIIQGRDELSKETTFSGTLVESLPGIFYLYDAQTLRLVRWNKIHQDVGGYTSGEMLGMHVLTWFGPENAEAVLKAIENIMREGQDSIEVSLVMKDGHEVPYLLNGLRLDAKGRSFFMGVGIDITERKRVEEALRQNTALFEAQVGSSIDGILVIDENNKRILVNQRIVELFNAPKWIMENKDDSFLLEHVTGLTRYPEEFIKKVTYLNEHLDETSRDEIEFKNGMVLDRYSAPVLGKDGKYYGRTWTFRDITERKRVEAALKQANNKLSLLSSITRHDIKNQLLALSGYLALIKDKQMDALSDQNLRKAETAAKRISSMIEFTKTYEGIGVQSPAWQDVRALIEINGRGVHLGNIQITDDVPIGTEVFADPLIAKVFHNLLHNAVRHGGRITSVRFSLEEENGVHVIVYEDDGIGIGSDRKEKLFTKGIGKDHGFGLFLSREILAITGIVITEEGEPGKGAKFVMRVPPGGIKITSF